MFENPVVYNGFNLNTLASSGSGLRRGCMLEFFDYGQARGVGYTEKRAQDDGLDASDVFMSARYITLGGTVYGEDHADLHDLLQDLRLALTPTVAYALDRVDYGYIPLEFTLPTNDSRFSGGLRQLEYRARPVGQPQFTLRRDGGANPGATNTGAAVQWQAQLECKDPRLYIRPDNYLYWHTVQTGAPILNRGDYPAPLDVLLVIAASTATSRCEIDVGGSSMNILVPSLPANSLLRYSGELKLLTYDNAPGGLADILRMDLLSFRNNTTHPKVQPGSGVYSVRLYNGLSLVGTASTGTRFMYSESFA